MIIRDGNNVPWGCIRIPKTGTKAYRLLFEEEVKKRCRCRECYGNDISTGICLNYLADNDVVKHYHRNYSESKVTWSNYTNIRFFTVCRNPIARFTSSLKYLVERSYKHSYNFPHDSMDNLVEFFYNNFDRNCFPKNEKPISEIFKIEDVSFIGTFFFTQVHWAYNPKVLVFRYENLTEYNTWLEEKFNFDISNLKKVGVAHVNHLEHLDFTSPEFIKLTEHLFHDDFIAYDYPLIYTK